MKNVIYFLVFFFSVLTNLKAQVIDFENRSFAEGTEIHDQFANGPCGVKFYLGTPSQKKYPRIAKVGGNSAAAFLGAKGRNIRCGSGAKKESTFDMPAPGQNVGCYFLTDDNQLGVSAPLNVVYENTTNKASGYLIDIDGKEKWTITAYDKNNRRLGSPVVLCANNGSLQNCSNTPSGRGNGTQAIDVGNGIATYWEFNFPASKRIKRIELKHTGSNTNVGLAFDNFAGCSTAPNPNSNTNTSTSTTTTTTTTTPSGNTSTPVVRNNTITFESGRFAEGQVISDQYSSGPCGVKFYVGPPSDRNYPRISKVGGNKYFSFQGPERNPNNSCGVNKKTTYNMPASGQGVGCYFLGYEDLKKPLNVVYENTTNKASGYLIDVDRMERWEITAFDKNNRKVGNSNVIKGGDRNTGDGMATYWELNFPVSKQFKRIEIKYTGTNKNVGLAFDNFSGCSTSADPDRNTNPNTNTNVTPTADKPIRYDIGCPPFNQELLSRSFKPKFVGGVNPSAKMEMNLDANFKKIGQTFIDYVNALYPSQQGFTLKFNLVDGGAGSIPKTGRSIANKKISFTAGGNGRTQGDSRFFSNSLKANQWYKIDLKVEFADNRIFSSNCDKEDFFYFKVNSSSNSIQYHNGSSVFKTKRLQSSSISGGRGRIE